jgi:hypothetical protein
MKIFSFGEDVKWFEVKVFNEREIRAAAWILFTFAIIAFMNSWLLWDFTYTKIFVIIFIVDFVIRLFINPKFAPSMILARIFVWNQKPEYVWAPQKRFAWWIGLVLSLVILYTLVLNNIVWPQNMIICVLCLVLFWLESMLWICVWCKMYNLFNKDKSKLCAWWVCEKNKKEEIQKVSFIQIFILILSIIAIVFISHSFTTKVSPEEVIQNLSVEEMNEWIDDCIVPEWAKAIWHEEKWKLHHNCQ